jgi:Txe/YoeB family toxin of Txe-Axe toxin-antitoxin module
MQVLINVPDTLPQTLIQKRIKQLEESLMKEAEKTNKKPSKWALLAERVNNDPFHLAGYSEQLKKDMQEFRENSEF